MACMVPLDENVRLCGVNTKIVTHSGRRSQLLLSATRCGHPSSYMGSSVDRALEWLHNVANTIRNITWWCAFVVN